MVGVVALDVRIGVRRPDVVVHPVEDAPEIAGARRQQAMQAVAAVGRLDFLGIGRADRGDPVGIEQARLQEADLVVVLQPSTEKLDGAVEAPPAGWRGRAPDRRYCGWSGGGTGPPPQRQVGRSQPGLPVMAMDHVGRQRQPPSPPANHAPPSSAARSGSGCRPVLAVRSQIGVARPAVHLRRIDDVAGHRRRALPFIRRCRRWSRDRRSCGHAADRPPFPGRRISAPESGHRRRSASGRPAGGGDIGQSAGLDQGIDFGSDVQDAHDRWPFLSRPDGRASRGVISVTPIPSGWNSGGHPRRGPPPPDCRVSGSRDRPPPWSAGHGGRSRTGAARPPVEAGVGVRPDLAEQQRVLDLRRRR